ncbi:MAG: hypothetical protein H6570_12295 [Lewinellaceae bacterium]|nr:hypothetical protein [Lewinellaceae bacterium]
MADNKVSTLGSVRLGTCIKNGTFLQDPIFAGPVSNFIHNPTNESSMTGQSRYTHNEMMNKGSFGVHGSYSGVVNLKTTISGYVGNAVAESSKAVKVNYSAFVIAGQEYLRTNDLTIANFINSLKSNVKKDMMEVLDNYNTLMKEVNTIGSLTITSEGYDQKEALKLALGKWLQSVNLFNETYGDGFVAGLTWGAYGILEFEMMSKDRSTSWKYGAQVDFSLAGAARAFALKLVYDGSQSSEEAEVNVSVQKVAKGNYIVPLIAKWEAEFQGKAFAELANVNALTKLPELTIPTDRIPQAPELVKPEKDTSLTDKLGKINNLKQLEVLAKVQAYEKVKKEPGNEALSLQDFLKGAQANALEGQDELDIDAFVLIDRDDEDAAFDGWLNGLLNDIQPDEIEAQRDEVPGRQQRILTNVAGGTKLENEAPMMQDELDKSFTPLGAILCNWSDLFPWLSKGIDNRLLNISELRDTLRWRNMIQDAQSLSILYYTAHEEAIKISEHTSPLQIADEFAGMSLILQRELKEDKYRDVMRKAIRKLGKSSKTILDVWYNIGFLRDAELGFGLLWMDDEIGKSLTFDRTWEPCGYDERAKNHSVYSSFQKVLPIIRPDDGRVFLFANGGFLGETVQPPQLVAPYMSKTDFQPKIQMTFSWQEEMVSLLGGKEIVTVTSNFNAFPLEIDPTTRCLYFKAKKMKFYPIPLSAAEGNNWKGGMAGSPSLKSFKELTRTLDDLRKDLKRSTKWNFTQPSFDGVENYGPDTGLNKLKANQYYVGIIPKPDNSVFPRTTVK